MKRIVCALVILLSNLHFLFAQNISDLDTFERSIKPRAILTYDVAIGEKKYQFIATIKTVGDKISFDWETKDPDNKKGTINVYANAVDSADAIFSDYSRGNTPIAEETALFISKKIFNDVVANAESNIKMGGAEDTATLMSNTISEFNFNLNGNLVSVPGWDMQGGTDVRYTLDVIESTKFPLITRLDIGWTMQLIEIRNP